MAFAVRRNPCTRSGAAGFANGISRMRSRRANSRALQRSPRISANSPTTSQLPQLLGILGSECMAIAIYSSKPGKHGRTDLTHIFYGDDEDEAWAKLE